MSIRQFVAVSRFRLLIKQISKTGDRVVNRNCRACCRLRRTGRCVAGIANDLAPGPAFAVAIDLNGDARGYRIAVWLNAAHLRFKNGCNGLIFNELVIEKSGSGNRLEHLRENRSYSGIRSNCGAAASSIFW